MTVSEKHAETAPKPNRVQGMVRSMDQWRNMEAKAVAAGSPAMIEYALIDAAHDIEALWLKCEQLVAALAAAEREGMRRADLLEQTFRTYNCPRPCNHRPDEFTIGECIDAGECGCSAGVAILSQANTHSVAPPPPGATEAGSVQPSADPATHHASRNGEG